MRADPAVFRDRFASLTVTVERNFSIESSVDGTRIYLATSETPTADRLVLLAPRPPSSAASDIEAAVIRTKLLRFI